MGDGKNKKAANSLLALSSAAVIAVYAAGYERTREAADRFTLQAEARRPPMPAPVVVVAAPPAAKPEAPPLRAAAVKVQAPTVARPDRLAKATVSSRPTPAAPPTSPVVAAPVAAVPEIVAPAAPVEVPPPPTPPPAAPVYKDGTYYGWGTSRHGDIQAMVVIEEGRIASATIAQCLTRYSCNVIAKLPPQVSQRQSPEVDYVSGATQSTNAFYYAVVEALAKAK